MKKSTKWKAKRVVVDGVTYASHGEYRRYLYNVYRQKAGEIRNLKRQVSFTFEKDGKPLIIRSEGYPNGRVVKYTADFTYDERVGARESPEWIYVVEEYKGGSRSHDSRDYQLRRALMEMFYGVIVREYRE